MHMRKSEEIYDFQNVKICGKICNMQIFAKYAIYAAL